MEMVQTCMDSGLCQVVTEVPMGSSTPFTLAVNGGHQLRPRLEAPGNGALYRHRICHTEATPTRPQGFPSGASRIDCALKFMRDAKGHCISKLIERTINSV